MGTTANLGLPYPENTDPLANIAAAVQALAAAIDSGHPAWQSYAPTLSNIALGNGVNQAHYMRRGKTLHIRFRLQGGTTTSGNGSGISLHLPPGMLAPNDGYQWIPGGLNGQMGGLLVNPNTDRLDLLTANGSWLSSFGNGSSVTAQGTIELA